MGLETATYGPQMTLADGPLNRALESSRCGRLHKFIVDESSEAMALFTPGGKARNTAGDWYGEHAGKWLIAASKAAVRAGDGPLGERVRSMAGFLARSQEANGYLGTYATEAPHRFTNPEAESNRTWDVWTHAYVLLGLLEVQRHWPDAALAEACEGIYMLLECVFGQGGRDITRYGNHHGLSSLILIHPLAELSLATGETGPAKLAERMLEQSEESGLRPVSKLIEGVDVSAIGTGKAYQLCWLLQGLARLAAATGRTELLSAAKRGWTSVRSHHLTLGGGPWGGIGRHKEVFNEPGYFSPRGMVETCSTMAWIGLNRALYEQEAFAVYAEEIEKALFNSVLGAMEPNGEDWSYFTFPNGRRNPTYDWACCKSSGSIALEEAAASLCPTPAQIDIPQAGRYEGEDLTVKIVTEYPRSGDVKIRILRSEHPCDLRIRIPSWAAGALIDGKPAVPGEYAVLRIEGPGEVTMRIPLAAKAHKASHYVDHHGQEIVKDDYFGVTRGPLVYAAGLLDGFRKEETLRAPHLDVEMRLTETPGEPSDLGPTLTLNLVGHSPIVMRPFADAGKGEAGAWRATWLGVAWQ